ncbi:MAG TPA: hypothetical protein VD969_27085 [Symbiobacteriaceae bacterium]|nr:hypothetical protein [Symbiobacteriaceae bacterium]
MSGNADKLRLADRTESILRRDRSALQKRNRRQPAILLTLVPDVGPVIDLMDAYMPEIAEVAGLQYVKLLGSEQRELPAQVLEQTYLLLADLTGRDESVVTLVYQALGLGRRVLLTAQAADEVPVDLNHVQRVFYNLDAGAFDALLRAIREASFSAMEECLGVS